MAAPQRCCTCLLLGALLLCTLVAGQYTTDDMVDLSTALITNQTMHWPALPYGYSKWEMLSDKTDTYWMESNGIRMPIHAGTHLDAPCHLTPNKDAQRLHEVPITRFFGPGAVIDIKEKVDGDSDYSLSMNDLMAWEEKNGRVPEGAIVLVHTGWSKRYYGDLQQYFGMAPSGAKSFPGVLAGVATFLVEERNINALGIDAGSPDPGNAPEFPVHVIMLGNNRLIIENVASSLETLPPTGYRIHAVPLRLHDTCGAPLRLMAFKAPDTVSSAVVTRAGTAAVVVAMLVMVIAAL